MSVILFIFPITEKILINLEKYKGLQKHQKCWKFPCCSTFLLSISANQLLDDCEHISAILDLAKQLKRYDFLGFAQVPSWNLSGNVVN